MLQAAEDLELAQVFFSLTQAKSTFKCQRNLKYSDFFSVKSTLKEDYFGNIIVSSDVLYILNAFCL